MIQWILSLYDKYFGQKDRTPVETKKRELILIDVLEQPNYDEVKDGEVYFIGKTEWKWLVLFRCPCGCSDFIHLSLLNKSKASWAMVNKEQSFSIYPSINKISGCKSHFFIVDSNIKWCNNE